MKFLFMFSSVTLKIDCAVWVSTIVRTRFISKDLTAKIIRLIFEPQKIVIPKKTLKDPFYDISHIK